MKLKHFLPILLSALYVLPIWGARVDTVWVESPSMQKKVQTVVIVPELALGKQAMDVPVIYLLHGYSGNAKTWLGIKPNLPQIADEKGILFVCPDGKNSWYWDSPTNSSYRYETFVSIELVNYIDANYHTIPHREGRAITGLSMGGHGAMWNALRHKETFGAAGSTSGGVDIRPFPLNWEMARQLGEFAANKKQWDAHTVVNQLHRIEDGDLAIIIDCGEGDFFLNVNKDLHQRLVGRKIAHDFIIRPGKHTGEYWNNSIDYQILFFEKFFRKQ